MKNKVIETVKVSSIKNIIANQWDYVMFLKDRDKLTAKDVEFYRGMCALARELGIEV